MGAVVAGVAIGGGFWWARAQRVPENYPASISLVMSSGEILESVGPDLRVRIVPQATGDFAVVVRNDGDRQIRIDRVVEAPSISAGEFEVSVGAVGRPVWTLEVRVQPQPDPSAISVKGFDASPDQLPFDLGPNEAATLVLRATVEYCVDDEGAISDHLSLLATIDGELTTIVGPEIWFQFTGCP